MDGMTEELYATPEEAEAAAEAKARQTEDQRKRDIVTTARERFSAAQEAEAENRRLSDEDVAFRAGDQWSEEDAKKRKLEKRPMLVVNRMPQFERNITNEIRQSKPAIQVSPVDSDGDPETAEVLQGLIRHIEKDSNADVAYDTASTCSVRGGFGCFRIVAEYESPTSFDQVLKIKRIADPGSVYIDPSSQEPDASDANFAFVVDDGVSTEEFKRLYPDSEPSEGGWGDRQSANGHSCQVVEYFYRDHEPDELLLLQPMGVVTDEETGMQAVVPAGPPVPVLKSEADANPEAYQSHTVITSRRTTRVKTKWCKIAGDTVVEETEFPSQWIPVIPVLGDEIRVKGKRILEGALRWAKDPQRMYNFWSTTMTETIGMAPKAPWIGVEGQFEGHENDWKNANQNKAYLQYRAKVIGGHLAPPPQRNAFEAPIAALTTAMHFAADDMKASTGIYDSALGNQSNEHSGRAILARQQQSQVSNFHFGDNLARALRHAGRILVECIQNLYDGERIVRILGEDMSEKLVALNGADPAQPWQKRAFQMGVGRYDVSVSMGPSYTSKRQEAAATQMEFMRVYPNAAPVMGDMVAENMDWPGAKKLAGRLKKLLPEGIAEPDEKEGVDPAALQHQLAQVGQQFEQLGAEYNRLLDAMETKQLELQSAERKDLITRHVDLAKAFASAAPEDLDGRNIILREMNLVAQRLGLFAPMPEAPAPAPAPEQQQQQPMSPPQQGGMNGY